MRGVAACIGLVGMLVGCGDDAANPGDGEGGGPTAGGGAADVGGAGGAGAEAAGWGSETCAAYGACVLASTPEAYPAFLQAYGEESPCWLNAETTAGCEAACASAVNQLADAFPAVAACQQAKVPVVYPAGPYGFSVGETFPNDVFAMVDDDGQAVDTEMSVFLDPTGEDEFGYSDPWPGDDKPKALIVTATATWSPVGGDVAFFTLPNFVYDTPDGGALVVPIEGYTPGAPFSASDAELWVDQQYPPFYVGADEAGILVGGGAFAIPTLWLVDTATMKIVARSDGTPTNAFLTQAYELAGGSYIYGSSP